MKTSVGFRDLRIDCVIGCLPEERERDQALQVDCQVTYEMPDTPGVDSLTPAVDYRDLAAAIRDLAVNGGFYQLESLARQSLLNLKERWPFIQGAWVRIAKPSALPGNTVAFVESQTGLS